VPLRHRSTKKAGCVSLNFSCSLRVTTSPPGPSSPPPQGAHSSTASTDSGSASPRWGGFHAGRDAKRATSSAHSTLQRRASSVIFSFSLGTFFVFSAFSTFETTNPCNSPSRSRRAWANFILRKGLHTLALRGQRNGRDHFQPCPFLLRSSDITSPFVSRLLGRACPAAGRIFENASKRQW